MTAAPERIWADTQEFTWVEAYPPEKMMPNEVEYVRADLPALSAAAMKRAALKAIDPGYGDFHAGNYNAVAALPDPSPADLLAEAARVLLAKWDADTASGLVYGPNEFAALLRAIAGGEA